MRKRRMRKALRALALLAVFLCLLTIEGRRSNRTLVTERFTFTSPALPQAFDGFCIVHLSDLHGATFGEENADLLRAVEDAAPDAIFITGDLVERKNTHPVEYAETLGAALAAIAPTYYVTGNHEWSFGVPFVRSLKPALEEAGVRVLTNEYEIVERGGEQIVIAGIDDPSGYADQKTPEELAAQLYANCGDPFWLLLAHRNDRFDGGYCRLGANLTFSGHGHGGLVRLPFTDGVFGTKRNLFPSFTAGFYHCTCSPDECDGAEVFVSRGLGNVAWTKRFFNPPELAVITLKRDA